MSGPLDLLAAVSKFELMECFRHRRGTGVGRWLANFLIALGPQLGRSRDSAEREPALAVLAKIGGPDYVRVVNDYLSKGDHIGRLEAIAAAHRVGDADTKRLLAQISRQEELPDGFPLDPPTEQRSWA